MPKHHHRRQLMSAPNCATALHCDFAKLHCYYPLNNNAAAADDGGAVCVRGWGEKALDMTQWQSAGSSGRKLMILQRAHIRPRHKFNFAFFFLSQDLVLPHSAAAAFSHIPGLAQRD